MGCMDKFLGTRQLIAKFKKKAALLRGKLPWPFSRKKPGHLLFVVHVERDIPGERTRHFLTRLITNKQRTYLALLSFAASCVCLGLAAQNISVGVQALEYSSFVGLIAGIGVFPLPCVFLLVSGIQFAAMVLGCVQCLRTASAVYRSYHHNSLTWMAVFSFAIYGVMIGLVVVLFVTLLYLALAGVVFRASVIVNAFRVN